MQDEDGGQDKQEGRNKDTGRVQTQCKIRFLGPFKGHLGTYNGFVGICLRILKGFYNEHAFLFLNIQIFMQRHIRSGKI